VQTPPDAFRFRSGFACIDLTATFAWHGRLSGQDRLARPADLEAWLAASPLGPTVSAATEDDLKLARELRGAIYQLASAPHFGRAVNARDVEYLNAAAGEPVRGPRLVGDGSPFQTADIDAPREMLGVLAQQAVRLLGGPLQGRIKECAYPPCWWLFVDRSRSANRRWCCLQCGQRVASRNYRSRRHGRQPAAGA
jgi:predicted RNA-binding Zn ribbon-like protein